MGKFKIGDTVRCVSKNKTASCGYIPYKEFVVGSVRRDSNGDYIYFPEGGNGVYECDLILVEEVMGKFKVGDTVRCVSNGTAIHPNAMGYKPDREFVVYSVRGDTDGDLYFGKHDHGVHERDLILIEKYLIEEHLPKSLPKSFACINTNQKLWNKYIKWLNITYKAGFDGDSKSWPYYGVAKSGNCDYSKGVNFDTILPLEEWDEIVNGTQIKTEEVMKKHEITREQLKEIHDVACSEWKGTITGYALRNPFGDTIEFTQVQVDTMFKAATPSQLPVLEAIFGKQTKELNFKSNSIDCKVDGIDVFSATNIRLIDAFITLPDSDLNYFHLNPDYLWEIKHNKLIVTRK